MRHNRSKAIVRVSLEVGDKVHNYDKNRRHKQVCNRCHRKRAVAHDGFYIPFHQRYDDVVLFQRRVFGLRRLCAFRLSRVDFFVEQRGQQQHNRNHTHRYGGGYAEVFAGGMRSPFRAQVPNKFENQSKPGKDDVMYGYRAFFKRVEGMNPRDPEIKSTLYLKHLGSVGISWCNLNEDNLVDVLIGRVGGLSDKEIEYTVGALRASNPILSNQLVSDRKVEICLRMSIARAVADGYVAIGDSAFMTMPLMGSGIESSMKAGKMFADYVEENKIDEFTAKNMWGFYHKYMTTLGADFAFVDVLKRWALSLDPKTIDWVFGGGLIEKSDLALVTTDTSGEKPKMSAKSIIKKVFLLLGHFGLVCKAIGCLTRSLKAKSIAKKIPAEYDEKKLAKWTKKYNKLIKN